VEDEHDIGLADHFQSVDQQEHAAHLGMWLFLTSELLLFGALFAIYAAFRVSYPGQFVRAADHNDLILGTANTLILITSSFSVAWAIHAIRRDHRGTAALMLLVTISLGIVFLCNKGVEYSHHFAEGVFPGAYYRFAELPGEGARKFFTLYFLMTGLHAVHVIAGLCVIIASLVATVRGRLTARRHTLLELGGLYWHLIDVIWIFLWPLMYLVK
jgi:cytochrome c oxidase subunit III